MTEYASGASIIPAGGLVHRAAAFARPFGLRQAALDAETERLLAARARAGNAAAAETLIRAHTGFVTAIARRYRHYGVPLGDLVQEGLMGLWEALRRFDPARGFRLSTYAAWWIRARIQEYIVRCWSLVKIGTGTAQRMLFFKLKRMMAGLKDGAGSLTDDLLRPLAAKFRVPLREVSALAGRTARADRSLAEPVAPGVAATLADTLADPAPNPEERAIEAGERRRRGGLIARGLQALSRRERAIILARYLAELGKTRETLARELGLSAERVRQLEAKALAKLKTLLAPLRPQG